MLCHTFCHTYFSRCFPMVSKRSWYESIKDGELAIYGRERSRKVYYDITINGHPRIRKSTGVEEKAEAKQIALDAYADAQSDIRRNIPIREPSPDKLLDQYLKELGRKYEKRELTKDTYSQYVSAIENYFLPWMKLKKLKASDLTEDYLNEYIEWRKKRTKSGAYSYERAGKIIEVENRPASHGRKPKAGTINKQNNSIRGFLKFAESKLKVKLGPMPRAADKERPGPDDVPVDNDKMGRWFTLDEYKLIRKTANRFWQEALATQSKAINKYKDYEERYAGASRIVRSRQLLFYWIVIMINTGMRPIEARRLRWKHVKSYRFKDGGEGIELWVYGKNRWRSIVLDKPVAVWFKRVAHCTTRKTYDEVIANADLLEQQVFSQKSFASGFRKILKRAGVQGEVYSLRHSYINYQLLYRNKHLDEVAILSGNSVKVIEDYYYALRSREHAERDRGELMWDRL